MKHTIEFGLSGEYPHDERNAMIRAVHADDAVKALSDIVEFIRQERKAMEDVDETITADFCVHLLESIHEIIDETGARVALDAWE